MPTVLQAAEAVFEAVQMPWGTAPATPGELLGSIRALEPRLHALTESQLLRSLTALGVRTRSDGRIHRPDVASATTALEQNQREADAMREALERGRRAMNEYLS
ncbi:hypothetical protein [Streptacidiphilus sp. EB103A]|uniref:hypothetical protein n=1 Tax=Streptacidiphilus sp. EB103A TaxID=3156275 RepID=UPI003512C4EB